MHVRKCDMNQMGIELHNL